MVSTTAVSDQISTGSQSLFGEFPHGILTKGPSGAESVFPRDEPPPKLGDESEFGDNPNQTTWGSANEFATTSELLSGMYKANDPQGKIALLAIEAISVRAKSACAMKTIAKHVADAVRFYLGARQETNVEVTGPQSLAILRDYIEPLAERGRAVPAAAKSALSAWVDALGIDWPLANAMVTLEAIVGTNEAP